MLDQADVDYNLEIINDGDLCIFQFLLIGGGGGYYGADGRGSGGGSGNLRYIFTTAKPGVTSISARTGGSREASRVALNNSDTFRSFTPEPGETGDAEGGGDGYSGGGGRCPCDGGSNGTDGEGQDGGHGSAIDVTHLPFQNFTLAPGNGGHNEKSPNSNFGKGGGGLLINGNGPVHDVEQGEGYGGGGGPYHNAGLHGAIIIEIVNEK